MYTKEDIFTTKKPAIGIDISDSSLKIMLLKYSGRKLEIGGFKETSFPKGLVVKDEIQDANLLTDIIKESLAKPEFGKLDSKLVIASLPESKCFIRNIEIDFPVNKEEVKEAMIWEAEQHIPLKADEVYMDFQIIPGTKNKKVLFTAAPKAVIDSLVAIISATELKPVILEVESFATARSLLPKDKEISPTLIIDIGTNKTGLAIFQSGIPVFTSSLEEAGKDLTEDIKKIKNISFMQAEKVKTNLDIRSKIPADLKRATEKSLDRLAGEIRGTLDFYREHFGQRQQELNVMLAGGGAKLRGIDEYLSRALKVPVTIGDPWINIEKTQLQNTFKGGKTHSVGFATVIGLALRGIDNKNS